MIEIKNLGKQFQNETEIEYHDITFESGKSYMLLGASGCGKSTLLNMIAGILSPEAGEIEIAGEVICHLYEGLDEKNCGKTGNFAIPFKITGDGNRAVTAIDITSAPDAFIGFSIRFANDGHLKVYAIEIK